jgi:A/G-specific adenine glycosylase
LALYAPPKAKSTLDLLWASAKALVESTDHPGDLNQALIELGSTVCRVRDPECASCPLRTWCKAYTTDEENVISHFIVYVYAMLTCSNEIIGG